MADHIGVLNYLFGSNQETLRKLKLQ
jgi:hypothetical protein